MAVWFGVDAVAGEMWLGPVFASGIRRLGVANFGRGLLIGVAEGDAELFLEVASSAGWRAWRVEPVFPACRLVRLRVPVALPLRGPAGVVLYRRDAAKFYEGLQRAYSYGLPSAFEPYVSSALLYGSVYRGYAVAFGRGSRGSPRSFPGSRLPCLRGFPGSTPCTCLRRSTWTSLRVAWLRVATAGSMRTGGRLRYLFSTGAASGLGRARTTA
jgi:hypothetical protein